MKPVINVHVWYTLSTPLRLHLAASHALAVDPRISWTNWSSLNASLLHHLIFLVDIKANVHPFLSNKSADNNSLDEKLQMMEDSIIAKRKKQFQSRSSRSRSRLPNRQTSAASQIPNKLDVASQFKRVCLPKTITYLRATAYSRWFKI